MTAGKGRITGKITREDVAKADTRSWLEIPEAERIRMMRAVLKDAGLLTRENGFIK